MKTVRLSVAILLMVAFLIPAVFLRSAVAGTPRPTIAQIETHCEMAIKQFAMHLMIGKEYGVSKAEVLAVNNDATPALRKLIDAVYDNVVFTKADFLALRAECVQDNLDANAEKS